MISMTALSSSLVHSISIILSYYSILKIFLPALLYHPVLYMCFGYTFTPSVLSTTAALYTFSHFRSVWCQVPTLIASTAKRCFRQLLAEIDQPITLSQGSHCRERSLSVIRSYALEAISPARRSRCTFLVSFLLTLPLPRSYKSYAIKTTLNNNYLYQTRRRQRSFFYSFVSWRFFSTTTLYYTTHGRGRPNKQNECNLR